VPGSGWSRGFRIAGAHSRLSNARGCCWHTGRRIPALATPCACIVAVDALYSALAPETLTVSAHRFVSAAMNAANSSGVELIGLSDIAALAWST